MEQTDLNSGKTQIQEPSLDLLYALNDVATALQQSIQYEENIFAVFQKQVVSLGLRGGISLLNG